MEYFYTTLLGLFTLPVSATLIYILYKIYKAKSNYHTMDNLLIGSSLLLVAMLAVGLCGFATADFEQNKETTAITIKDKWTEGKNYYFVGTNNVVYSISKSIWKSEGYDNIPYIRFKSLQIGEEYTITYINPIGRSCMLSLNEKYEQ